MCNGRSDTRLYLGIDTSNYTTSVALCDGDGRIVLNHRRILDVAPGERGLRQSDAVFSHIKNAGEAADKIRRFVSEIGGGICAVGVSSTPTYADGSYMPCFMSGLAEAQITAAALGVPLYKFSHQAGHIMAALYSADALYLRNTEFAAFHVSGGTTDVITVRPDMEKVIYPEIVGGTLDLSAGKVIDRIGVLMGFPFPAGRYMEDAAKLYSGDVPAPAVSVRGLSCNLSGLENKAAELYRKSGDAGRTAAYVLSSIKETLARLTGGIYEKFGDIPLVFAGGVMSCKMLKNGLAGENRFFAAPEYSADNACGIALLAYYSENMDKDDI